MAEKFNLEGAEPEVLVEDELSNEERIDLARKAVENLSLEMQRDEKFPGYDAFRRVMNLVVLAEDDDSIIENWHKQALEWEKEFAQAEDDAAKEEILSHLRSMLEVSLASAEKKLTVES